MKYDDRESIMKQWDNWRKYIAEGGTGSWPRDAFEALLDEFKGKYNIGDKVIDEDGNTGYVVIMWGNDGSIAYIDQLVSHPNPVIIEETP